ncbi:DUF3168 domain-containing protein [Paraburkholderia sp. Ac-20340]|uniref:DUF3168 domain-containing protein n=1 Tax=Paraburkholderia sp. Ac-20340 TaxID=2703888 RepID=UPI00197EB5A0|nr:DUF3168 domain-containing protein [Paraburkholderia sp. Ac-20340]MBN3852810.1 DUF3168 domain-containing protein [Paraburkholderia sp. Ac-20340]
MNAEQITVQALKGVLSMPVYPDDAPNGAKPPYAVYQAVSGVDFTTLSGANTLQNCRMQIAIWSADKGETVSAMQAARVALIEAGGFPIGGPQSEFEDDTNLYGRRQDVSIYYTE